MELELSERKRQGPAVRRVGQRHHHRRNRPRQGGGWPRGRPHPHLGRRRAASSVETLYGKAGTDTVELVGPALTAAHVSGAPPAFTVTDPVTGGVYGADMVEAVADT